MKFCCPQCGEEYDSEASPRVHELKCSCGYALSLDEIRSFAQMMEGVEEDARIEEIQRLADQISQQILNEEYSEVDIEIAKARLKEKCLEYFPDKMHLYEMIYESRFRRLWEQFREKEE